MSALQFPCKIFETQKKMNDKNAKDMKSGDLSEIELRAKFHLVDVSTRVDPYTMTKISPFSQPQSMFHGSRGEGEKLTRWECAEILFDELRHLSILFALHPPYNLLIDLMITHMQKGNGKQFSHQLLDSALKEHIVNDKTKNSTLRLLKDALDAEINWESKSISSNSKSELNKAILDGKLPKFDRYKDNFNGLGITVHDTWATHITIKSLYIDKERYHAEVHYQVQDHFGLDDDDISKFKFKYFRFFGIWFILQRYSLFSFKPFMTNMKSTVDIYGERNESKK